MEINLLTNYQKYILDVSMMIYKEFVEGTNSKKTFRDVVCFFENTNVNTFPITFIAIINNKCVGTVSVFENDLEELPQYKPWLASLYVDPEYRSQKIGKQLINFLLDYMGRLGYKEVFLKTENASNYYIKRGWHLIESLKDSQDEQVDIFKYILKMD
ncbi:GNAT family N-acetyltransferase [Solibacillus sp. CAU 1738]|uniref:GNAT family N-acetyltransferase n=1 Tax=Solibacillus sp. CAU 1738 TaxID=3140363 RepID=UPI00326040CF